MLLLRLLINLSLCSFNSLISTLLCCLCHCKYSHAHKLVILMQTFPCTFMHHTTLIRISSPVYKEHVIHISTSLMYNPYIVSILNITSYKLPHNGQTKLLQHQAIMFSITNQKNSSFPNYKLWSKMT